MKVELRDHPARATIEARMPDGTIEVVQARDDDGNTVPLIPDEHGIYFQATDESKFTCVGYCKKAPGKPACLIEHFPPAVAEFIHSECDRLRGGGVSRLAMISAPEAEPEVEELEEEPSPIWTPDSFDAEEDESHVS